MLAARGPRHRRRAVALDPAADGGVEGGMTDEADDFIRSVMADMLDKHQGLPREPVG